jgi:hypothetical protein
MIESLRVDETGRPVFRSTFTLKRSSNQISQLQISELVQQRIQIFEEFMTKNTDANLNFRTHKKPNRPNAERSQSVMSTFSGDDWLSRSTVARPQSEFFSDIPHVMPSSDADLSLHDSSGAKELSKVVMQTENGSSLRDEKTESAGCEKVENGGGLEGKVEEKDLVEENVKQLKEKEENKEDIKEKEKEKETETETETEKESKKDELNEKKEEKTEEPIQNEEILDAEDDIGADLSSDDSISDDLIDSDEELTMKTRAPLERSHGRGDRGELFRRVFYGKKALVELMLEFED